jgi:hypothetical protein
MSVRRAVWLGLMAAACLSAVVPRTSAHSRLSQVTWTRDVAPIVEKRCLGCHASDGVGQVPLTSYQEARSRAKDIADAVLNRRMPPWSAARGFGDFSNDRSLSAIEIDLLTAWATGGTPLGTEEREAPVGTPTPRSPDVVLNIPAALVRGSGIEHYELTPSLAADRWIAGWEFLPGRRAIVERATLAIAPGVHLGTWAPPDGAVLWQTGMAQRLPAGSRLTLEVRYRKSADPVAAPHRIALYFGRPPRRELEHRVFGCTSTTIDRNIDVLALEPAAAEAGESIEVVARRRDGSIEPLCIVPRFLPGYATPYRFRQPVRLERGTIIDVRSSLPGCGAELDFVDAR